MSRPEDSYRGEPDPLIRQLTDWRNELIDVLERLRTGELNEGEFGSTITAQDLRALLERYDDTIMRLATRDAQKRSGLKMKRDDLS